MAWTNFLNFSLLFSCIMLFNLELCGGIFIAINNTAKSKYSYFTELYGNLKINKGDYSLPEHRAFYSRSLDMIFVFQMTYRDKKYIHWMRKFARQLLPIYIFLMKRFKLVGVMGVQDNGNLVEIQPRALCESCNYIAYGYKGKACYSDQKAQIAGNIGAIIRHMRSNIYHPDAHNASVFRALHLCTRKGIDKKVPGVFDDIEGPLLKQVWHQFMDTYWQASDDRDYGWCIDPAFLMLPGFLGELAHSSYQVLTFEGNRKQMQSTRYYESSYHDKPFVDFPVIDDMSMHSFNYLRKLLLQIHRRGETGTTDELFLNHGNTSNLFQFSINYTLYGDGWRSLPMLDPLGFEDCDTYFNSVRQRIIALFPKTKSLYAEPFYDLDFSDEYFKALYHKMKAYFPNSVMHSVVYGQLEDICNNTCTYKRQDDEEEEFISASRYLYAGGNWVRQKRMPALFETYTCLEEILKNDRETPELETIFLFFALDDLKATTIPDDDDYSGTYHFNCTAVHPTEFYDNVTKWTNRATWVYITPDTSIAEWWYMWFRGASANPNYFSLKGESPARTLALLPDHLWDVYCNDPNKEILRRNNISIPTTTPPRYVKEFARTCLDPTEDYGDFNYDFEADGGDYPQWLIDA